MIADRRRQGEITAPPERIETQVAVIGSGPGGAITAALLSEAGRDVLLIEEGPFHRLESCRPFSQREMLEKYRNGGVTVAMGRCKVAYVEGRCVGGGSEINSGLYHRTPPEILDRWRREFQVHGLREDDLDPHFSACERDLSVSYLPGAGPPASLKLHLGAESLGWRSIEVPRWFRYDGDRAAIRGTRQSMTETFVPRALASGAVLLPNTRVLRLSTSGGRWRLAARHGPPDRPERGIEIAADTVFVAGGAVQTPALLRRSGIKRNVGDSLKLHATIKVVARFPEEVNDREMGVPVHQVKQFAPRFSFGCSISTPPYLALAMLDHPEHLHEVNPHWRRMAIYYAMITGGCGSVRPAPSFRDPLVRYRLGESDLRDLSDAVRELCRCLFASGAEALYPSIRGAPVIRSENDSTRIPRPVPADRTSVMTIHLMASCPMGENRERCAVDSYGKVHGVDGLYVADASLLCGAPGVNPQGSVMALVRRNALATLERTKVLHGSGDKHGSGDRRGRMAGPRAALGARWRVA